METADQRDVFMLVQQTLSQHFPHIGVQLAPIFGSAKEAAKAVETEEKNGSEEKKETAEVVETAEKNEGFDDVGVEDELVEELVDDELKEGADESEKVRRKAKMKEEEERESLEEKLLRGCRGYLLLVRVRGEQTS